MELVNWVKPVHDMEGISTTVVFDGQGTDIDVQRPFGDESFSVVFSPSGLTADSVIERMVGNAPEPATIGVVSGDRVLAHTVMATGGDVFTVADFENWVQRAERSIRSYLGGNDSGKKKRKRGR